MRTLLTGEFATATAWDQDYYVKFEVQNASGTWIDVGAALGREWVVNAKWSENIDQPVSNLTITLVPIVNGTSLSPLMATSPLNVDDSGAYAPLVEIGRLMRMNVATMPTGVPLDVSNYRELFTGRIDDVQESDAQAGQQPIQVQCSDLGAWLMDIEIESTTDKQYGTATAPGTPLETVIQDILNDNIPAGEPAVTLYKQSASTFAVTPMYTQHQDKLLNALVTLLLDVMGEDIRYRYDASHVSRLTWFNPDRNRTTVDATFDVNGYVAQKLDRSIANIRNAGRIPIPSDYVYNADTAVTIASKAAYRRRFMQLPASIQVMTEAQAQVVIDAAVNDLAGAPIDASFLCPFLWFVQLYDRYTFPANDRQFSDDQTLCVVGADHTIESGRGQTVLTLTGRVLGSYAYWLKQVALGGSAALPPTVDASPDGSDDTGMDVTISATPGCPGGAQVSYRTSDDAGDFGDWSDWVDSPETVRVAYLPKNTVMVQPRAIQADGQTTIGKAIALRGQLPHTDPTTGQIKRAVPDDDGNTSAATTDASGFDLHANVEHSGGAAVNLQLSKPLAGAPNTADSVPAGLVNRIPLVGATDTSGNIDLSGSAFVNKTLDHVSDGTRKAVTAVDGAGKALIDFTQGGHTGKHLGNVPDDATSGRAAIAKAYVDSTNRPTTLRDPVAGADVGADIINDAQARARSGLDTAGTVQRGVPLGYAVANVPAISATTGKALRGTSFDDGYYAVMATVSDGSDIRANVETSVGTAVNRGLAKALSGDPDTADAVQDGLSKRVPTHTEADGGGRAAAGLDSAGNVQLNVPRAYAVANLPALSSADGKLDPAVALHGTTGTPVHTQQNVSALADGATVTQGATRANSALDANNRVADQSHIPLVLTASPSAVQTAAAILSCTGSGSSFTISIAANALQFGFGQKSYNSGSVVVSLPSTLYYVYTDDPTYAAGAVTYHASSSPLIPTADSGRYYVGAITTPPAGGGSTTGSSGGTGGQGGYQGPIPS